MLSQRDVAQGQDRKERRRSAFTPLTMGMWSDVGIFEGRSAWRFARAACSGPHSRSFAAASQAEWRGSLAIPVLPDAELDTFDLYGVRWCARVGFRLLRQELAGQRAVPGGLHHSLRAFPVRRSRLEWARSVASCLPLVGEEAVVVLVREAVAERIALAQGPLVDEAKFQEESLGAPVGVVDDRLHPV